MYRCFACICVSAPHQVLAWCLQRSQEEPDFLEMKLQAGVSCHVSTESQPWTHWESSRYSQPLSYLSSFHDLHLLMWVLGSWTQVFMTTGQALSQLSYQPILTFMFLFMISLINIHTKQSDVLREGRSLPSMGPVSSNLALWLRNPDHRLFT